MRRNWDYRYTHPKELRYDAMIAVGIAFFIGFFSVMAFKLGRFDDDAKTNRWIGSAIGFLFFVVVWGGFTLLAGLFPDSNEAFVETGPVVIILLDAVWAGYCLKRKFDLKNASK